MTVIGLAGGSGTGKTTIARHLVSLGAAHIDADRVGHEVLDQDEDVRRRVREEFGDAVFAGRQVDRAALGRIVFADDAARQKLDTIIHPAIILRCRAELKRLEEAGVRLVVVDAALLLTVRGQLDVDYTIALRCGREERARRLREKGGSTEADIARRLDAQADVDAATHEADAVIDTDRPLEVVLADVDRLIEPWLRNSTE